jgi:mevalonate kinase
MAELSAKGRYGKAEWAIAGLGLGSGATVAVVAVRAIAAHPELLAQLLNGGFLYFSALMAGMVLFRKEFRDFNAMQARHVAAQEKLAASVGDLVSRDDQRAREQEITLNHLARQSEEILKHLREMTHGGGSPA